MKNLIVLIIFSFLFSGCTNKSDIGVIGGADGPTEIIVSEANKVKEYVKKEEMRIVKLNDSLYYEVDEDNENITQHKFVGELKKTADRFEIPQNNGECNFKDGSTWRNGVSNDTIEVFIDDDWEIFAKIDTNTDIFKYKYCYVVEGILPNARDDSEFLVLANDLNVTFEDASYKMLGADMQKMKDIYVLPIVD